MLWCLKIVSIVSEKNCATEFRGWDTRSDSLFQRESSVLTSRRQDGVIKENGNPDRAKTGRVSRDELKFDDCGDQRVWMSRAKQSPSMLHSIVSSLPGLECKEVENVCVRDNWLVHVGEQGRNASDLYWAPPIPKNEDAFSWFAQSSALVSNLLDGYFDGGGDWVQQNVNPLKVRIVSNTKWEKALREAPRLDSVPVMFWSHWSTNFGESFTNFLFEWLMLATRDVEAKQHPLILVNAYSFPLPRFWRLLEAFYPAIESVGTLGRNCGDTDPPCFRKVIGCGRSANFDAHRNTVQRSPALEWAAVLAELVPHFCSPSATLPSSLDVREDKLVVGFGKRDRNRLILNLPELLVACSGAVVSGRRLECVEYEFSDITKDICWLQGIDVLVTTHGANAANANFMRPGTSMIELKAKGTYENPDVTSWLNACKAELWLTNSTFYWFYGLNESECSDPGTVHYDGENHKMTAGVYPRDWDTSPDWSVLQGILEEVVSVGGDKAGYEKRTSFSNDF